MNKRLEFNRDDLILKACLTFLFAFIADVVLIQIYLIAPINEFIRKNITESNLMPYAVFIVFFVVLVVLIDRRLSKSSIVSGINALNQKISFYIGSIIIFFAGAVIGSVYILEMVTFDAPTRNDLLYHMNDVGTVIIVFGIFCMVSFLIETVDFKEQHKKADRLKFYIFALTVAMLYGYAFYTPNCFTDFYNIHHVDAYYFSVYRTMMGVPRSYMDTGIYGFYSLLLAPAVKLAGGTFTSFFVVISILGGISLLCVIYAIDTFVKNPIIKVAGTLSLTITMMSMGQMVYLQLYPHRTLFPAILMFYMSYLHRNGRKNKRYIALGYAIAGLSIMWSTEMGIICLFGWAAYVMYEELVHYRLNQLELYRKASVHLLISGLTFAMVIGIVNIVNLSMGGGTISLKDFLFPLLTSDYMTGYLLIPFTDNVLVWWVLDFGLFCAFLAHCIIKISLNRSRSVFSSRDRVYFGISVMGLAQMTYYINRTAWGNIRIVHYNVILLLCILADWGVKNYKSGELKTEILKNIYKATAYVGVTVLVAVSAAGISNYYNIESSKNKLRDTSEITGLLEEFQNKIPKNTRAIGNGVSEIYSYLGWDSQYYFIDISDVEIMPDTLNCINQILKNNDSPILLNARDLELFDANTQDGNAEFYSKNVIAQEIDLNEIKLYYYVPKEN